MTLPAGIDEATWSKALRVMGHLWREGQKCYGVRDGSGSRPPCDKRCGYEFIWGGRGSWLGESPHDIPMPDVTDELLMRMLRFGMKEHGATFYAAFDYHIRFTIVDNIPDAAIILATASLEGK